MTPKTYLDNVTIDEEREEVYISNGVDEPAKFTFKEFRDICWLFGNAEQRKDMQMKENNLRLAGNIGVYSIKQ